MTLIPQEPSQRGLRIPATIDAELTLCLTINIPNDPTYIEHIQGVLAELGSGWLYQNDPDRQAALVAQKWKQALQTIEISEGACMPPIQLRACTLDCGIEFSTDGGDTWECISLANCIGDLVGSGIDQAITDGLLSKGVSQEGPTSAPPAGECHTYHVKLNGRDRWHVPSPLSAGDTIRVTNAAGGWSDDGINWYCPDGSSYTLGTCGVVGKHHDAGDKLNPGAYHMSVIGNFGATYFDPMTAAYQIPGGTPQSDVFIQANDGTLTDNQGEIEFDVEVCTGATYVHVFDFTTSNGGFVMVPGERGTWTNGQGWNGATYDANSNPECVIQKTGIANARIIQMVLTFNRSNAAGANKLIRQQLFLSGNTKATVSDAGTGTGTGLTQTMTTDVIADQIRITLNNGSGGGTNRITRLEITGIGTDPF